MVCEMNLDEITTPSNHYETLDELKRLLAEADDDFANGCFRTFRSEAELRSLCEDIKVRGRARLDAERKREAGNYQASESIQDSRSLSNLGGD